MTAPWLLVSGDFTLTGGMDKANYHLAWHLAERRDRQVHLVAHRVDEPLASHPQVRVHAVRRPLGRHALGAPLLDWTGRRTAARLTAADPVTHVLVNGGNCLWPGANWVHMVNQVCQPADRDAPLWFRLKNRLNRRNDCRRERQALGLSRLILANSERTRRDILAHCAITPERTRVVYLGTDSEHHGPVTPEERTAARKTLGFSDNLFLAVFVGALGHDSHKGFDTLLRAFQVLPKAAEMRLWAAGGGAVDRWRRRVADVGLADWVRFLGLINNIPTLLAAADILISPTRYEPYGLAVHEALCRGVPAIVSQIAGVAERYPPDLHDLLLPDPEDAADLARRLRHCLDHLEDYRRRVAPFAENLRSRSWDDMAAEMVGLVEEFK